jgi:hypothetical protein
MNRIATFASTSLLVAGCQQPRSYQFDFSREPGFEWDGKVTVTKTPQLRVGPLLILDEYWTVDRVEFSSRDGRIASIDTRGSSADATVDPNRPTSHRVPGLEIPRDVIGSTFVLAGKSVKNLAGGVYHTATQPVGPDLVQAIEADAATRRPPAELRPYAEHVDQLSRADWCAIALEPGNEIAVEYRVSHENLRIVIHGSPRRYAPGVLEVWTADGRLLKRYDPNSRPGTSATTRPRR